MEYQFKYKLPDGLQVKPATDKPLGVGQAKHAMLEGRPAGQSAAAPTRNNKTKPRTNSSVSRVAIIGSAFLIIAGSAWYLFAPDKYALGSTEPAVQPLSQSGKVTSPAATPNLSNSMPALQQSGQVHGSPAEQGELADTGDRDGLQSTSAGPDALHTPNATLGDARVNPQDVHQPINIHPSARVTSTSTQNPTTAARQPVVEDAEAVEPEPPRNRWRTTRADDQATQRRQARPEPRNNARQSDGKSQAKLTDRERLF